jgi:RNA polymerase sigma-70 factor (ECF subfamily)
LGFLAPGNGEGKIRVFMVFKGFNKSGEGTQLSGQARVTSSVSSLALDRSVLSCGVAASEEAATSEPLFAIQPSSDAEVMLRAKAGDDSAFSYLVEKYRRPMVGFMYRMTHNAATAEELAQEVFLRVYRSRESYKAEAKFTTWLYRIATNLAMNHARDTRNQRPDVTTSLDEPDTETGMTLDVADSHESVEQDLLRRERLAGIRQCVQALPERQRVAVLMHKYQGMDYRQIGEVLKLSEAATKSLLFRAYETLRQRLKQYL